MTLHAAVSAVLHALACSMHHHPGPNHLHNSYNGLRNWCFVLQIIISSLRQCFRRSINNKKCFLSLIRRTLVLATTRTEICTQHCHQPQYLDLTLQYTQAVISVSHVQVFVQVSCPVHQHGVGALGAGRGSQVPMLRPGGPGWSLHRVQAQRQQRPQRPPGG